MIFFVDVAMLEIEMISKDSFNVVIENLDDKFIVDEFFFEKRSEVVLFEKRISLKSKRLLNFKFVFEIDYSIMKCLNKSSKREQICNPEIRIC